MNREQALDKIRKCLALSRSANEHEAAAALRQAQALMREHSISGSDVDLAKVTEQTTAARSSAINTWESRLANCVAEAFGCQHFSVCGYRFIGTTLRRTREVVFVGIGASPQVASYAYDVLSRQCAAARLVHVRKQPKTCKPITRTARGDQFAIGWVYAVRQLVERFAGRPGDQALIETYIATKHPELKSVKPRNTTVGRNVRNDDLEAGFSAGKSARLNQGLAGGNKQLRIA